MRLFWKRPSSVMTRQGGNLPRLAPAGGVDCWRPQCAILGAVACRWQRDCLADGPSVTSNVLYPKIGDRSPTDDPTRASLARTIEGEIIPRLMLAHRLRPPDRSGLSAETDGKIDVTAFCQILTTQESTAVIAYIAALVDRGATVESLYLDLLAPTARRLGDLWDQDLVDFIEVTSGMARLHCVMTAISGMKPARFLDRTKRPHALLISMADETHDFGIRMVEHFFRRANWEVRAWPRITDEELSAAMRRDALDIVGISISRAEQLDRARAAICLIRKDSCNEAVKIMAGGAYLIDNPHAAAKIGADADSRDAISAVEIANNLIRAARKSYRSEPLRICPDS